jgi:hypothetical protein
VTRSDQGLFLHAFRKAVPVWQLARRYSALRRTTAEMLLALKIIDRRTAEQLGDNT